MQDRSDSLATRQPAKSVRCPGCQRRASLKEKDVIFDTFDRAEAATWQCIYCGTVSEPSLRGMRAMHVERIVLAPGELEALRDAR